jgi:hypothetical protein
MIKKEINPKNLKTPNTLNDKDMGLNKKQKIILLIGIIIVFVLIYYAIISTISPISGNVISASKINRQIVVTKENLHLYIENQKIIQELPKDALISLRLYNFDTGVRQWEKAYVITKGNVEEANAQNLDENKLDADIIISSKHVLSAEFCTAIKQARANNDFGYELKASKASLLWKYRGLIKYKDCFE